MIAVPLKMGFAATALRIARMEVSIRAKERADTYVCVKLTTTARETGWAEERTTKQAKQSVVGVASEAAEMLTRTAILNETYRGKNQPWSLLVEKPAGLRMKTPPAFSSE